MQLPGHFGVEGPLEASALGLCPDVVLPAYAVEGFIVFDYFADIGGQLGVQKGEDLVVFGFL